MTDMIVSLQQLPPTPALPDGYHIDIVRPWDSQTLVSWVEQAFSKIWANEVLCGLTSQPSKVLVISKDSQIIGFAGYNITFPGFFGPTGVLESERGLGLGKILLIEAMHRLHALGHVYAFIGDPGPVDFYQKTLGAVLLPADLPDGYTTPLSSFTEK